MAADLAQIVIFPYFLGGVSSPLDAALDTAVAGALWALLGWHWAFLPTFAAEAVPFLDLVPTWTAAVFLVTRTRTSPGPPEPTPSNQAAGGGRALPPRSS
jgi:hypothetical protein